MSECDWERLTRKTNGKSPSWAGVTWCMGWWRCGVGCRPTTSLFHRQSVYRVQIVWSWMVVWPQGQRPWRQPHGAPLNSLQNPCTWWYRGIFSISCYLLKNSLTEPESCIYQVFASLTVISKSSYFSISCNHPYIRLSSTFTVNSVTLTVTSKNAYFSISCNHPIYKTV